MTTVVTNLQSAGEILAKRGLEPNGRVQRYFTSQVADFSDPYIPFRQGMLKNNKVVLPDKIMYLSPYARNMYYGTVMVDPITGAAGFLTNVGWRSRRGVKKVPSGREYGYSGAPTRGKLWDKRMWADKGKVIVNNVANMAGGRAE